MNSIDEGSNGSSEQLSRSSKLRVGADLQPLEQGKGPNEPRADAEYKIGYPLGP